MSKTRNNFVRVPKTAELVASNLRRRIISGDLQEGDNLPSESTLVEDFGVSRPTMREAFRILETERLISVSRGSRGGAKVHRPDVDVVARYAGHYLQSRKTTLSDVYDARLIIEPVAAAMMAKRKDPEGIARLKTIVDQIETHVEESESYSHLVAEFHLAIIQGSGNETMTLVGHVLHMIWDAHLVDATTRKYDVKLARRGLNAYRKFVALVEAGDASGAEKHIRNQMKDSGAILLPHYGNKFIDELFA